MQNFGGILFQLDRDLSLIFMEGAVQEITGYSKEDFLFGNLKWDEIVVPEDMSIYSKERGNTVSSPELSVEFEYRIREKRGRSEMVKGDNKTKSQNGWKKSKIPGFCSRHY